ncbi:pectate lyase [Pelomonas sp. V22]|uniref:pectate lyase n=1 Tax=Pelomonas sp. V22 TaxID=2822139 RepID=UPI0024A9BB90|nr:pectate lyase [Pelomonas sp. V22]MDI4633508.1 pectate lyase [Pelomonas sp. V22]
MRSATRALSTHLCLSLCFPLLLAAPVTAAVIGTNPPAPPLNAERVAALPTDARAAWSAYLARSKAQLAADRAALAAERQGLATLPPPPEGGHAEKSMPLQQPAAWYATAEALKVADNILSFQTPAGGWGKNQPRDRAPRLKGQDYVADNNFKSAVPGNFDLAADPRWSYVGTIDNDATITEIRFLARVAAQLKGSIGEVYRQSAIKGLNYLLAAQFPNGGWPQVWPLQGGYHDAVTLNDNAVVEVAELMEAAARGEDQLDFLPPDVKARAAAAGQRALQLLLDAQMVVGGRKLLWAQQYDALTLAPVSARNYEPPSLCVGESTGVLVYLMSRPAPSAEIKAAVRSGIAALRELAIKDKAWGKIDDQQGRRLTDKPGAEPVWARYYDVATLKPIFGDRDKSLHDNLDDISLERRNGYAWYGTWPKKALQAYEDWSRRWGSP